MRNLTELRPHRNSLLGGRTDALDDVWRRFFGEPAPAASWVPAAEVLETPQAYIVNLDAPGLNPDAVEVTLAGDTLTVQGERKLEERGENENVHLSERRYGPFTRSFTFPAPVAADGVEATASHGVISIRIEKAKEAQPRKVQVKTR